MQYDIGNPDKPVYLRVNQSMKQYFIMVRICALCSPCRTMVEGGSECQSHFEWKSLRLAGSAEVKQSDVKLPLALSMTRTQCIADLFSCSK